MLSILAFAAALVAQAQGLKTVDPPQGVMPGEFHTLSQPHPDSDVRLGPDIVIGSLRIDGDTLYVQVRNVGAAAAQGSVIVSARAEESGKRSNVVQARTGPFQAGEARWVPLRGFSIKTASTAGQVFALADATSVAASAKLLPLGSQLDRSGQARLPTPEANETNNSLVLEGSAIDRGAPR